MFTSSNTTFTPSPTLNDGTSSRAAEEFDKALKAANEANEARYQDILGGYKTRQEILGPEMEQMPSHYADREFSIMGEMSGLGRAARADLNRRYDQEAGNVEQSLIDRGLGNTTVLGSMTRGVRDQQDRAMNSLNEQLRRERLGYRTALSGDTLGAAERSIGARSMLYREPMDFMERREDLGPSDAYLNALLGTSHGAGYGMGRPDSSYRTASEMALDSINERRGDTGGAGTFRTEWLGGNKSLPENQADSDQLVDQDYPTLDESGDDSADVFDPLKEEEEYLKQNPDVEMWQLRRWRQDQKKRHKDEDWSATRSPEEELFKRKNPREYEQGYRTQSEIDWSRQQKAGNTNFAGYSPYSAEQQLMMHYMLFPDNNRGPGTTRIVPPELLWAVQQEPGARASSYTSGMLNDYYGGYPSRLHITYNDRWENEDSMHNSYKRALFGE